MASSNNTLVYPDDKASLRILNELVTLFSGYNIVNQILLFGSHTRGDWDRWSDIDLLLITSGGFTQQWHLFNVLKQGKSILHHHTFTPHVDPYGSNVLGIVFTNESVFHNLDLNFMSAVEFESSENIRRFGQSKQLYFSETYKAQVVFDEDEQIPNFEVNLEERKIGNRIHWTKKAIKHTLRQHDGYPELRRQLLLLDEIMKNYPEGKPMLGGDICRLARIYLEIGTLLLADG